MILYLDTSALVKLYLDEPFRLDVLKAVADSDAIATHTIGFVEAHATFARLQREGRMSVLDHGAVKQAFTNDWENYLQIESTPSLLQQAASFAEVFSLRAYDAVQLAAAHFLVKQNQPTAFGCFDRKLNQAAEVLGLTLLTME